MSLAGRQCATQPWDGSGVQNWTETGHVAVPVRLLRFFRRVLWYTIDESGQLRCQPQRQLKRSIAMKGTYEKPVLVKHEPLRDVTAGNSGNNHIDG